MFATQRDKAINRTVRLQLRVRRWRRVSLSRLSWRTSIPWAAFRIDIPAPRNFERHWDVW